LVKAYPLNERAQCSDFSLHNSLPQNKILVKDLLLGKESFMYSTAVGLHRLTAKKFLSSELH